jgi:hypothetical protein
MKDGKKNTDSTTNTDETVLLTWSCCTYTWIWKFADSRTGTLEAERERENPITSLQVERVIDVWITWSSCEVVAHDQI